MKALLLSFLVIGGFVIKAQVNESNRQTRNNLVTNKVFVNVLDGKPISFFLNHKEVDLNAKRFYRGEIGIQNDETFREIMDSLIFSNSETQPFYFFVFNQIVDLSYGKQEAIVANRCKEYVEDYPCEFFRSFNQPELNINVVKWTNYIGISLKDKNSYAMFRSRVDSKIKPICLDSQDLLKSFIAEVRMCLIR